MKKILFILSISISAISYGQVYQRYPQSGRYPRLIIDSVLSIPLDTSGLRNISGGVNMGQLRYNLSDSSLYVYTGTQWVKSSSSGGGGSSITQEWAADGSYYVICVDAVCDTTYWVGDGTGGGSFDTSLVKQLILDSAKYSITQYGLLTDSATTNLYKFRVDSTVMESQARAVNRAALNVTLAGTQTVTGDKTFTGNIVVPNQTYPALTNKAVNSNYVDGAISAKTDTSSLLASKAWTTAGLALKQNLLTNPITGTGTQYQIPIFSGTSTLAGSSSLTQDANGIVNATGVTQTGSSANGILNLSQTWNTTGIPSALRLSITNTASNVNASLMEVLLGGVTQFSIYKNRTYIQNNLCIGTTSNQGILDVVSAGNTSVIVQGGNASDAQLQFRESATARFLVGYQGSGSGFRIYNFATASVPFFIANAGNIGINNSTPNVSAALDISSTTKGVLLPRMTTTQKLAIASPAEGLEVYDLTLHKKYVYDGTIWQACW